MIDNPSVSAAYYFVLATRRFRLTQAWQAEFVAIGLFVVLSVYLRERWSAESKPVESSNQDTGKTNE